MSKYEMPEPEPTPTPETMSESEYHKRLDYENRTKEEVKKIAEARAKQVQEEITQARKEKKVFGENGMPLTQKQTRAGSHKIYKKIREALKEATGDVHQLG